MSAGVWDKFVQLPFKDRGRDWTGVDCWGLVRLVYQTVPAVPVTLPLWTEVSPTELRTVIRCITAGAEEPVWRPVETKDVRMLDVVLMSVQHSRMVGHVGVMINDTHCIHTERGANTCVVPLTDISIRNRIRGFRRHKDVVVG